VFSSFVNSFPDSEVVIGEVIFIDQQFCKVREGVSTCFGE